MSQPATIETPHPVEARSVVGRIVSERAADIETKGVELRVDDDLGTPRLYEGEISVAMDDGVSFEFTVTNRPA